MTQLIAALEKSISPGIGTCKRCKRPWIIPEYRLEGNTYFQLASERFGGRVGVRSHMTPWGDNSGGCFPLCEGCWQELKTPQARLSFYRMLWDKWKGEAGDNDQELEIPWAKVEVAVFQEQQSMSDHPSHQTIGLVPVVRQCQREINMIFILISIVAIGLAVFFGHEDMVTQSRIEAIEKAIYELKK